MSETLEPAPPRDLDERAERLMHRLCDRGWPISTAESCIGGTLAGIGRDLLDRNEALEGG